MNRPDFTDEEEYMISFYKSHVVSSGIGTVLWHELPAIVPAVALAGWGMWDETAVPVFLGFLILLFFKLRELM